MQLTFSIFVLDMKLVFATHNMDKLKEVQKLLPDSITLLSLDDIQCFEEIKETAKTLEGNARIKADYVTTKYGYDCFADDTGLEVDALEGAPGVYSARYAGEDCSYRDNVNKLIQELKGIENRKARFRTIVALNLNGKQFDFEGICEGEILTEPAGTKGFGYDPVFRPDGFTETFAEISIEQKGEISHRGKAISKLISFLNANSIK